MMEGKKLVVMYHSPCMDGYAAACAHFVNSEMPKDRVRYVGVSYGFLKNLMSMEKPPFAEDETHILFLDICPTGETLEYLHGILGFDITVLDHHATAREILVGSHLDVNYLIADKYSGASLTASLGKNIDSIFDPDLRGKKHLKVNNDRGDIHTNFDGLADHMNPLLINALYTLLEVRDIWIQDDPWVKSRADDLAAYFKFHDTAKEPVQDLMELVAKLGHLDAILAIGKAINDVQSAIVNDAVDAAYKSNLVLRNGKQVALCVGVCPDEMGSMFGDNWNKKNPDGSLAIALFFNLRANEIGISLRSNNKLARMVAENIGGGGHDDASGACIKPDTKVGDLPSVNAIIRKIESILTNA